MSVALQAALTLLGEKNHPSIMQTSAEQLITILSNIASNPEEKKYRKLKLTNRVVAEKVLPAKGAKPLLQAVGFGQAEGHALLIMQGRDVDVDLLSIAIDGLQRLLSEKADREAAERAQAVAKNRVLSTKMRETQTVEKERKDELGKTIKQQQHYDRLEKAALDSAPAGSTDMGATQALQQLYTANGAADGQAVGGLITVRISTADGQNNLQLKESATFGDLRAQIEAELQIPGSMQIIGLGRSCTETVSSDRVKLKSKGITNGSIIGLKYPGFTRTDKVGVQESKAIAEMHTEAKGGKGSLRETQARLGKRGITLQEFEALQAERSLDVKQQTPEDSACEVVSCDRIALKSFTDYVGESLHYSCKRCALLYGTYTADAGGVEVDALYEPAQDNTPEEINIVETAEEIALVDEVAAKLGLHRVGWIFFHPEREHVFTANEVLLAATLQNEAIVKAAEQLRKLEADLDAAWGPEKAAIKKRIPAAQAAAECGKRFVTLKAKPERDTDLNCWIVQIEPYQMSDRCLELTAAGKFHQSKTDPSKAKVSKPLSFVVEGKEVQKMDLEFFLVNVAIKYDYTSILAASFAQANRFDKPQEHDVKAYFDGRSRGDVANIWSDFNLLVFAAKSGKIDSGDFDSIIKTVTSAGVVPLESAVAQRAKGQILPLGVGGGGGPTGIGNYGSGGFGGGRGGGTSAASAMDVEQVPAPAAGSGLGHGPGGGQWAEQIANLTAMGFDREAVAAVLEATQGNVEQAIQILTS